MRHHLLRPAVVGASVSLAVLLPAAAAQAHVTITPSTTAAGEHAVLQVSMGHGCAGSPTTEITVQIPEGINSVTPTRHPLWTVEKQVEEVDPPIEDSHGNGVVERVASVTYSTDNPLPEGYRDVFELSVTLPESTGDTLVFPTVQRCEEGESAWTEVPEEGQSIDDLEQPAPAFTLTEAAASGHGSSGHGASVSAGQRAAGDGSETAEDGTSGLAVVALGAGVLGILIGAVGLLLHRRST